MKLRIWHKEADPDQIRYVRLRQEDDRVIVCLVDEAGDLAAAGNLLVLEPGKPVFRCANVLPKYGFPLNKKHQLQIKGLSEAAT